LSYPPPKVFDGNKNGVLLGAQPQPSEDNVLRFQHQIVSLVKQ
ncbi:unnamed protein product, partial [marine sediment metagenome]